MGAAETLGGATKDSLNHPFRIFPDIPVPHAKHGPTLATQPLVADGVARRARMLSAVSLHNEPRLPAR